MTDEELEHKAKVNSLVYDTKYAEDGTLKEMLSRPQDFVDGAIMGIVQLLRKKANRDGFIAGAKEMQKEIQKDIIEIEKVSDYRWEENQKLKAQIEEMKMYCDCEFCRHCGNELTNPETGETICGICVNNNLWELKE